MCWEKTLTSILLVGKFWRMRSDRQIEILNLAKCLILEKGFYALSYQDLSNMLGITKASIHGHFKTKETLGIALLEDAREELDSFMGRNHLAPHEQIEWLLAAYEQLSGRPDEVCLVTVLQHEFSLLPESMKTMLNHYHKAYVDYVAGLLDGARVAGTYSFPESAHEKALFLISAMQGAVLNGRSVAPDGARVVKDLVLRSLT